MPLTSRAAGNPAKALVTPEVMRLTSALAAGDEAAFRELHSRYFDRLLRYLFVVTRGDEEAARDALQETFTRVVRHIRPFDSEQALWCWLTVIARSAATDAGRKRARYWQMLAHYGLFWRAGEEKPGDVDASVQLDAFLDIALQSLETTDRELIEQKYFQGNSVRELAARFQMTEKAVESRLARVRRRLREELSKLLRDEEER